MLYLLNASIALVAEGTREGVEELSARQEALLLGKRRLTKVDQEIMRWRTALILM